MVWERPIASKKPSKKQDKKKKPSKKSGKKKQAAPARPSVASSCEMSYSGLTCEMTQTRLSTLGDAPLPSGLGLVLGLGLGLGLRRCAAAQRVGRAL